MSETSAPYMSKLHIESHRPDAERLVSALFKHKLLAISPRVAEAIWMHYSDEQWAAGWIGMPATDELLVEKVSPYLAEFCNYPAPPLAVSVGGETVQIARPLLPERVIQVRNAVHGLEAWQLRWKEKHGCLGKPTAEEQAILDLFYALRYEQREGEELRTLANEAEIARLNAEIANDEMVKTGGLLVARAEAAEAEATTLRARLSAVQGEAAAQDLSNAPESILLTGSPMFGCDTWQWVERCELVNGQPAPDIQRAIAEGQATPPVRYVRADVVTQLHEELRGLRGLAGVPLLNFPRHKPTATEEQYFCLCGPDDVVLLMWASPTNGLLADELEEDCWCEWDGSVYEPTQHVVRGFWPHPKAPTEAAGPLHREEDGKGGVGRG